MTLLPPFQKKLFEIAESKFNCLLVAAASRQFSFFGQLG